MSYRKPELQFIGAAQTIVQAGFDVFSEWDPITLSRDEPLW